MEIKFEIVDENYGSEYEQRFVIGIQNEGGVVAEYDFPTRIGQSVNFRERNLKGVLDSIQDGKSLPSPVKEGGKVNLFFKSLPISTNHVAVNTTLNYLSTFETYGSQDANFSYTIATEDTRPENSNVKIFIGSYVGGCIRILDWKVN